MTAPDIVTRMQCITCRRRLAHERAQDGSDPQVCVECRETSVTRDWAGTGIPLAVTAPDIDEAVALALSVVELNGDEKPGEGHVSTDLAIALLAQVAENKRLHASRYAEAKVVEAAVAWRQTPCMDENGSSSTWVGALVDMERAVDDLIRLRAGKEGV